MNNVGFIMHNLHKILYTFKYLLFFLCILKGLEMIWDETREELCEREMSLQFNVKWKFDVFCHSMENINIWIFVKNIKREKKSECKFYSYLSPVTHHYEYQYIFVIFLLSTHHHPSNTLILPSLLSVRCSIKWRESLFFTPLWRLLVHKREWKERKEKKASWVERGKRSNDFFFISIEKRMR